MDAPTTQQEGDAVREIFKRWPRLYYAAVFVLGPVFFVNLSPKAFLRNYPKDGPALNVGSGPRVLRSDVINIDIVKYESVSIVADAAMLPFENSTVGRIVYDSMLEHVERPEEVIAEAARVVSPGGYVYIATPFVYPFHSSPHDFTRWTTEGLRTLLERHGFEVLESGGRGGPFSILVLWFAYFFASLLCFGSKRAFNLLLNIFLVLFFPLKLLDIAAAHLPFMTQLTSVLYVVGRRKNQ